MHFREGLLDQGDRKLADHLPGDDRGDAFPAKRDTKEIRAEDRRLSSTFDQEIGVAVETHGLKPLSP
jgi:hypothetical protein